MIVRLLTDGGYHSLIDDVGEVYKARKEGHYYLVMIKGNEYVFYSDELEIFSTFEQAAEDNAAIKIIVVSIIAALLCMAAIIYVIF